MVIYAIFGLIAISAFFIYKTGYSHAQTLSLDMLQAARTNTYSIWQKELHQQENTLNHLEDSTKKSLDAMAGRLSILQGYVMRLDALGSRLASMANLDDIEFGVENPPGIGGPIDSTVDKHMQLSDLLISFNALEKTLQDRSEKLTAMESMLINRTLQEQTSSRR